MSEVPPVAVVVLAGIPAVQDEVEIVLTTGDPVLVVVEVPAVWVANMVEMAVVEVDQAALMLKMDRVINPRILNLKYRTSLLLQPGSKSNVLLEDIN